MSKYNILGLLGCLGGLFIHLIVGSAYQWGIINGYITSYFKILSPQLTLQGNSIVFPVMMFSTGLTIEAGVLLAEKFGAFWVLLVTEFCIAGTMFGSSYLLNFTVFVVVYGCIFGLLVGITFLIPIIEINKYFPGRRMQVNGFILMGTGLAALIFGQFSSAYINPQKIPSVGGYYSGESLYVAQNVPSCLRYLALIYLGLGLLACFLMLPVIITNKRREQQRSEKSLGRHTIIEGSSEQQQDNMFGVHHQQPAVEHHTESSVYRVKECPSVKVGLKSKLFWAMAVCGLICTCGNLLINGNYRTYVKKSITDDQFLALIGSLGGIANGCSRFLWNLLFLKIGYRGMLRVVVALNLILFLTIRWTVQIKQLYGLMVLLSNACLGAMFVSTPTYSMMAFGQRTGSLLYSYFTIIFSVSSFLQFIYVSYLTTTIGFNNVFWICFGTCALLLPLILVYEFKEDWPVPPQQSPNEQPNRIEPTQQGKPKRPKQRSEKDRSSISLQLNQGSELVSQSGL